MSAIDMGGLCRKIAVGTAIFGSMLAALPALAGVGGSVIPSFPTPIKVGDIKTATITVTNRATAPNNTETVNVSAIFLTPSCQASDGFTCQSFDRNVFQFGTTATGKVGTSCASVVFTIGPPNAATGEFELIPQSPVVLGPANGSGPLTKQCIININFQVLRAPLDSSPPNPPLTTDSLAHANLQGSTSGALGAASGGSQSAIGAVADLFIGKTDGQTTVLPGSSQVYTVTVSNAGPSEVAGMVVADTAPAGVTFGNWSCAVTNAGSGGFLTTACGAANGSGNLNTTATLKVGGVVTYSINATVTANSGTITNTASVTPPSGTINTGTSCVSGGGITRSFVNPTCSSTDVDNVQAVSDLSITKTDGVSTVNAGGTTTYTVVVSNAGPTGADGAIVTDAAATGLTKTAAACLGATGGAACPASTTVLLLETTGVIIPTLPVGGTVTFTITANVTATSGSVTNTAVVAAPAGTNDPTPANNTASDTDTVQPVADVSITKSDGVTTVNAGGSTTYTVVVSNAGPSPADGTIVTDAAATGLNKTAATCTGATGGAACPASTTVLLLETTGVIIPTLPVGGTVTFTITANVTATSGSVTNTAVVAAPAGNNDPTPANNTASDTDTVQPVADVSITKDDGVTTVNAGGTTTYTILVSNAGPSPANGTIVTDAAATGLAKTAAACLGATGGAACPASTTVLLLETTGVIIPTLPVGGTVTFTITATVNATSGSVINTTTATLPGGINDPSPANNTASDTDTVQPVADVSITKNDGVTTVNAGGSTTYTVVVSNTGPSPANGTVVTDAAATGLNKTAAACLGATGGAACPASTTVLLLETTGVIIPTLPVGGTVTFTITANVTATSGSVTNTAVATQPAGTNDPTPANNTASDTDTVQAVADLSITKTDGTGTVNAGGTTTYTIVVTNGGPSAANNAIVTDPAVTGLSKTAATCTSATNGAVCPAPGNVTVALLEDAGVVITTLPATGTVTFTVTANVTASGGSVTNTAVVAAPVGTTDPTPGDNTASDTDTVQSVANLSITKTDGGTSYTPGGTTTYTIVVTNGGPSPAVNAVVADTKPAQVATWTWVCTNVVNASDCTPQASGSGNFSDTVTIQSGGSITYTVTAVTSSSATSSMTNSVTVTPAVGTTNSGTSCTTQAAPNARTFTVGTGTCTASDLDTAALVSNLTVTKSDGVTSYTPGTALTYTIVVGNNGPSDAINAVVTDNKPSQISTWTWVCSGTTGGASGCTPAASSANNFTDTVTLPVGSTITYTVTANITNPTTGDIVNTVTVTPATAGTPGTATDTDNIGGPGIFNGHFDYDIYYYQGDGDYANFQHVHRYDDVYDRTGVNMLHPSEDNFRLNLAITNPATQFKILVMNQYLNPAVRLAIGPGAGEESVKTYGNLASQTNATTLLAGLPTYTTANIGTFIFNLPTNAFSPFDWWGDGQPPRAGLMPTRYSCVWDPDTDGTTDTPGQLGERSNGALTIQIIRANTPDTAIEPNVAGAGNIKYGWRVKQANFTTYVLAEYTGYWHHPNELCYTSPGWVRDPGQDLTTAPAEPPAAGADDPNGPYVP